jgi:radical SAM superfamily enzyme YgiQ (UPF0313 family)
MRIVFVQANYRSGGAEIAGSWSPAWVAYLAGPLRRAGFDDIHFIDAMTDNLDEEAIVARLVALQPDLIGATAITPSIYMAERVLELAKEHTPNALRVLGGIHPTRVAIPNMARGCPFTCSFCSQWKFWRDYRVRDPKKVVDEIENLVTTTRSASSSSPTRSPPSTARSSSSSARS